MLILNKFILLNDLSSVFHVLKNKVVKPSFCFYGNRIVFKHDVTQDGNSIRIWRTTSILDYWYDKHSSGTSYIGALDYTIQDDGVKIDYININDKEEIYYNKKEICYNKNKLSDTESTELMDSMMQFMKTVADKEKKPKIKLDVHGNLHTYNKYFENVGFINTKRKSQDNPFWVETELNVK